MRGLALAAAAALAAVAIGVVAVGDDEPAGEPSAASSQPPNLLVVMTDDQPLASFNAEVMPATLEFFEEGGTVFENAIAAPPLCCPARAGFLTGRYAHNHGVVDNDIGYESMAAKDATLPIVLQAAGYRTGLVGKFLSGYERVAGAEPAPGFDHWYAIHGYADYFGFQVSDGGELREVAEYATDDLTRAAIEFTTQAADDSTPFFLWLAYNAPHYVLPEYAPPCDGQVAQPPDAAAFAPFADAPLPESPAFDEDTTDKPSLAGGPDGISGRRLEEATRIWRCSLAATAAVDDGVAELLQALRDSGQLDQTVVVYLSDNGYFYGEHRLTQDKRLPLDPALRIPLAIRVGEGIGGEAPASAGQLVSQVDLPPTLLDYAGVESCPPRIECHAMDGRSLRGVLEGAEDWPGDRAVPLELDDGWTYRALRTATELYAEFEASRWAEFNPPAIEYYDLARDPNQLENIADDPAAASRIAELHDRLSLLERCAGIEGRDAELSGPFCE